MMGKMEMRSPPGTRPRDGRHCDLCGCSQPAVRCDKCGCQIFCLSCDDMYHRHPKRRFHLRKAVDPIPAVPQARPVLPMKVSHLNATNPGDPSKMPLPPPRKKKSLFSSFRKPSPSGDNSPPLPKKEYSWTDRLGSIKKFMSNRPLPPLPSPDDNEVDGQPATNGQVQRGDLSFIHKRTDERPPQLPQRSPRSPDFPGMNQEKENRIPSTPPHLAGQIRNGHEPHPNHVNHDFNSDDPNMWSNQMNHQNNVHAAGTLQRQRPFMPPGAPGYPGGMHQSSSATDLHSLQNAEGVHGPIPPHYPHYPMNPHMPPHYPYPMYPGYPNPNYPNYFGNSFANLSNPPTSEGDFSDSESSSRHSSRRHAFRKRAKRSQSVMVDRMAYPGQFFPFGPYPGYGPWGAPMPMETPPSPASSLRSLNRTGRTRRRKKGTSEDDDEELSETSSPMSRPKSSSSDPKEHPRAPLATQTTSSEDESDDNGDKRRNKINTIRRQSEPMRSPSPVVNKKVAKLKKSSSKQSDSDTQDSPAARSDRRSSDSTTEQRPPVRQSPIQQQAAVKRSPTPQQAILRESPVQQSTQVQPQTSNSNTSAPPETWECRHCTYINPIGNRICQVCCKTATPRTETPVSGQSRPSSSSAKNRKDSVGSENEYFVPDEKIENEASQKEKQDMASLNSALDEAEKQISKGLEELMKLKDDFDSSSSKEKTKPSEIQSKTDSEGKPVYKSSGRMRTSILDKLNLNKSQATSSSVSTSTETQTDKNNRTIDKIIEARRLSNSSSASETYNSPLAQSPELDIGYQGSKQKRDSSCQTQQDSIAEYLEKRKAAEEAFLGRPINNFGFSYGDRMDMMTSPVPSMYDRFYGGGYGMQRSHSRASLFTGRMNDFGPMDYGPGPGFGYGPAQMYRSVSRGSLTGDYPDGRVSGFHNIRKPDYYLSMEELVERRCQDNINNIRAQGLELVRMIREAEQQGFNADDIQVALTHCGKQNPLEWLQENWRNMVDSVVTLSTNYGNDKKENDIGLLSENESRDALRLHKGNIWAAVTECVEGRQRKYLELCARGNFSRQDIVDALTSSEGDVEMAYAKLTKSTGKPFLMRIWGQGEGAQNQDGVQPMSEDYRDGPRRYLKDETLNNEDLSDDLWSDDEGAVDWDDEEEYEEERGDIEDLRTCQEDFPSNPDEVTTPESERSEYCDAFSVDDRNVSSPSDDIFFVIPESKPEKKKGFLSKLVALRKDSKEHAETTGKEGILPAQNNQQKEEKIIISSEPKNGGALNTLKNKFSAIKDTVTGGAKNDKKVPSAQLDRRTIIVRGQLEHESLSSVDKEEIKLSTPKSSSEQDNFKTAKSDTQNREQAKYSEQSISKETPKSTKTDMDKTSTINKTEDNNIKIHKNNVENESKPPDSITTENKNSQSLAERLKFAKQTSTPIDAPGPSGIKKENLKQPLEKKQDPPVQSQKEMSLQKLEKVTSETIPIKEPTMDNTNINTIPNLQNFKKSEPKENTNQINKSNQQIHENIINKKAVPSKNDQRTKVPEIKDIPYVSPQDSTKDSNLSPVESSKPGTSRAKTPTSNVTENTKEKSPKTPTEEATNKTPADELESQVNSKTSVSLKVTTTKVNENKPNSISVSKKDKIKDAQISEVNKEMNVSKTKASNTISDLSVNSASPELKSTDYRKEKSEVAATHTKKLSPEVSISDNKTPTLKGKVEKVDSNVNIEPSQLNSEPAKLIKEENKIVQKSKNNFNDIKISDESKLQKSDEQLKNSELTKNQTAVEKPQQLLEEGNTFKITEGENLIAENNESTSKNANTVENIARESVTSNEIHQASKNTENQNVTETPKAAASTEILNTEKSHELSLSEEISKSQTDVSSDHNKHKGDVLTTSDQALIDSDISKNVKEANVTDIPEQKSQINSEQLKISSENQSNEKIPAASSSMSQENQPAEVTMKSSENHLEVDDKSKVKSISEEISSNQITPNQTNITVNKANVSTNSDHAENFPQTSMQNASAAHEKGNDISSVPNQGIISENSDNVNEIKQDDKDNVFMTHTENSNNLLANSVIEQSQKTEDEAINLTKDNAVTNSMPSDNGPSNLVPDSNRTSVGEVDSLKNTVEVPNENTNEQHKNELQESEKVLNIEETVINNSINSELNKSQNKETLSSEETNLGTVNVAIQSAQVGSSKTIKSDFISAGNSNMLTTVPNSSKLEGDLIPTAFETVKEQEPEATQSSSSEVIKTERSKETELQEPIFSKEFPNKSTIEASESSTLSDNSEIAEIPPPVEKSVNSESPTSALNINIPESLKISDTAPTTSTTDSVKTSETFLSPSSLENVPSSSKNIQQNSETLIEHKNVPVDSKTAIDTTTFAQNSITEEILAQNSVTEIESSNAKIIETAQNSSDTNFDSTSVTEKTNVTDDSSTQTLSKLTISDSSASSSTNSNLSDKSETITSLSDMSASVNSQTKEIPTSEPSNSSADVKSLNKNSIPSTSETTEQHSKVPETVTTKATTSVTNSNTLPRRSSFQFRKFQRTISEERKEDNSGESDGSDTEYSDNSRRGSLILPSPVDTLRSRFEGLASGSSTRGDPIRPASPFRRMSFNSRKQVIALERKRDTAVDKPWFHKVHAEPVKIVQPKKSIKQQLEMERKVRQMVADRKCRTYKKAEIVVQLMDMNFEEEEAIQAANECSTLEQAISYLQQECLLCAGHFPVSQIVSMTHCEHRACWECIRAYFTVQIRDRTILDLLCPFCNEPDIGDEDVAQDYFNHLDIMLKKLVDIEIHELFQRKLRDRVLMKDPNFRWCSQCSSGFIAMPNLKRLICPDCNAVTCASCRRLWEREHQGISCEAFAALKDASDPEAQAAGLAKLLTEDGISCPSCHFRYALAKGGCMHFRCIQCQHDFCSGCSRPFKMGQKCGVSEFCGKLGLHAHHPRNCLFYLRDKEPEDLQKLLDMNDIKYNKEPPDGMEITSTCQVMEQKETADGMVDDYCGKDVQEGFAGLCRVHYVEYLGQLVNKHKVDPIQIFDNDDLELVLKRANIRLPPKRYRENDIQYREKLIKVIQEELPLDRMDGS